MFYKLALIIFLLSTPFHCLAKEKVINVGGYLFPPFVEVSSGSYSGLAIDMIQAINEIQEEYIFKFVLTSPKRRFLSFKEGHYDLMLFESKSWGWQNEAVSNSRVFLEGGEVYIAKNKVGRSQEYFNDFNGKKIACVRGYHYGFADFNSDTSFLKENFLTHIVPTQEAAILSTLGSRSDIAVVTVSYLNRYMSLNPEMRGKVIVSEKFDQKYNHTILVNDNSPFIDVSKVNKILLALENSGKLKELFSKYGIIP